MINLYIDICNANKHWWENITNKDIVSLDRLFENFIWIPVNNCAKDRLTKQKWREDCLLQWSQVSFLNASFYLYKKYKKILLYHRLKGQVVSSSHYYDSFGKCRNQFSSMFAALIMLDWLHIKYSLRRIIFLAKNFFYAHNQCYQT